MDAYAEAIEYIMSQSDPYQATYDLWDRPRSHLAGVLFSFTSHNGSSECGCITQVKTGDRCGSLRIGREIRADPSIPRDPGEFLDMSRDELETTLENFANYQRRLDRELGRRLHWTGTRWQR